MFLAQLPEGPQQYVKAFPGNIDPHAGDQDLSVLQVKLRPGFLAVRLPAGKAGRVGRVVDDFDLFGGQSFVFGHIVFQPAGAGDVPVNMFIVFCLPRLIKGGDDGDP